MIASAAAALLGKCASIGRIMPALARLACVLGGAFGIALACTVGSRISAQPEFPDRAIKVLVGFSAGGGTDVIARILAQKLSETLSQSVVVENRTGASGLIAAEAAAKAAPDGYTLMMGSQTTLAVAPTLYRKSGLAPAKQFTGIAMAGASPLVLVVHPALPVHSAKEVIAMAKASPGAINFGSGGAGTTPHMAAELFSLLAGIMVLAYRAGSAALRSNPDTGGLYLAWLLAAAVRGLTEAAFRMMSSSWIFLLLAAMGASQATEPSEAYAAPDSGDLLENEPQPEFVPRSSLARW